MSLTPEIAPSHVNIRELEERWGITRNALKHRANHSALNSTPHNKVHLLAWRAATERRRPPSMDLYRNELAMFPAF